MLQTFPSLKVEALDKTSGLASSHNCHYNRIWHQKGSSQCNWRLGRVSEESSQYISPVCHCIISPCTQDQSQEHQKELHACLPCSVPARSTAASLMKPPRGLCDPCRSRLQGRCHLGSRQWSPAAGVPSIFAAPGPADSQRVGR